ncbi:MAG: hypothetical protein WC656_01745 [Sulfurimonas sp.]
MKIVILSILATTLLLAEVNSEQKASLAERGSQFYKFNDLNTTDEKPEENQKKTTNQKKDISATLEELLTVAKEQRDIQKKIYELLAEEINPTPQTITVNGKECIENSSAECFKMPLTNDAKKIPVLKAMLVNPTPETAKDYLQWQAKYLTTGPFKVGRSFQYAMNTYGEEAYPMNINRSSVNTNTDELNTKRKEHVQKLLNDRYSNGFLGLYIFLGSKSLDQFSVSEISKITQGIKSKKAITFLFASNADKDSFFKNLESSKDKETFKEVSLLIKAEAFKANNIYMTPTYMAVSNMKDSSKKQAVAIGRVSEDELNAKMYEWLEQESIVKRGELSDHKVWNSNINQGNNK